MSPEKMELWQNGHVLNKMLRPYYRADLPFHNFDHALKSTRLAHQIAKTAVSHGADIDLAILPIVGRGHDAGTWLEPQLDHPFDSREAYAADIVLRIGKMLVMPEPKLSAATEVVKSTELGKRCTNNTERAFRQGDLAAGGLLDSPRDFLNGTYRLYKEQKIIKDEPLPSLKTRPDVLLHEFTSFSAVCYENLRGYLKEDLSLGDFDRDSEGRCLFFQRALPNLNLLVSSSFKQRLPALLPDIINYRPQVV